jgi:hypothetical protein
MENQNKNEVQIDWGTWDSTPTDSQKTETVEETVKETADTQISSEKESIIDFNSDQWKLPDPADYSYLGAIKNIELIPELYILHFNNNKAIKDLNLDNLERLDDDNKFKLNTTTDSELSKIIGSIRNIGAQKSLKLSNAFLVKNPTGESNTNIFKGKPLMNFLYVLKGNRNSGSFVLDLTALGGPAAQIMDTQENILILFEGWVPYRITKNQSQEDLLVIAGSFD